MPDRKRIAMKNDTLYQLNTELNCSGAFLNEYYEVVSFFCQLLEAYDFDAGAIYFPDSNMDGTYKMACSVGFPKTYRDMLQTVIPGIGFGGTAMALKKLRISNSMQSDQRFWRPTAYEVGYNSFVSIPLIHNGEVIGLINYASKKERSFPVQDRNVFSFFGRIIANCIQNYAKLQNSLEQADITKRTLLFNTEIGRCSEIDAICDFALKESLVLLNISAVFISVDEPDIHYLKSDISETKLEEVVSAVLQRIKKEFYGTGAQGYLISATEDDLSPEMKHLFERLPFQFVYALPLKSGDDNYGDMVFMLKQGDIKTFHVLSATQIAQAVAAAIGRSLLQKMQRETVVRKEYDRISREMHDTLAQQLSVISNQLEYLKRHIRSGGAVEETLELIEECAHTTREAITDVRENIFGMRHLKEDISLEELISAQLKMLSDLMPELQIVTEIELNDVPLKFQNKLQLVRIMQETLSNIRQHSQATEVHMKAKIRNEILQLEFRDNGIGFNVAKQDNGFGLSVMQERAEEIGGKVSIRSSLGKGTTVLVEYPLKGNETALFSGRSL